MQQHVVTQWEQGSQFCDGLQPRCDIQYRGAEAPRCRVCAKVFEGGEAARLPDRNDPTPAEELPDA